MKKYWIVGIVSALSVVYSCSKEDVVLVNKSSIPKLPETPYSYFNNNEEYNHIATLGRVLFYERQLSKNNAVSCGSCHKQAFAFADNVAFSTGLNNVKTDRNSMPIQNLAGSINMLGDVDTDNGLAPDIIMGVSLFWDGRETSLTKLVMRPVTNHIEMGIEDFDEVVERVSNIPYYEQLFVNAYGDSQVNALRIASAVAVFMESISSNNSKLDRYNFGDVSALNEEEKKGRSLFFSTYNCGSCHNPFPGPYLTTTEPKNIGLDLVTEDEGFGRIFGGSNLMGTFKTPNLKNVALTAPYMHDGRFKTLDEVLEHYSTGVKAHPNLSSQLKNFDGTPKKLNIPEESKAALKAFLLAMTDYTTVLDPKFSDPFN